MNSSYSFGFTYNKINKKKKFFFELIKVKGFQYFTVKKIFNVFNLSKSVLLKNVEKKYSFKLLFIVSLSKFILEKKLRNLIMENIKIKKDIGSYQGYRHELKLPCRGQGTKRNGKNKKEKKKKKV